MAKLWRIHAHDAQQVTLLERAAGIPAVVAQLLIARGITDPQDAKNFLEPRLASLRDPETLPGCAAAAERIMAAIAAGEPIVVYGDYDVDGMASAALLSSCLKMLGAQVSCYVPHRLDEGYGLHCEALETLAQGGAKLIVTVDCGITCAEQAARATQLGIDLIITDHHSPSDTLPKVVAIVHPGLPGSTYPFAGLCGAGVAFKLAWAVCQRASESKKVSERMRNFLMQALGLVALATVADCVPLLDENRVLVTHGLVSLKQRPTPGMAALLKVTGLAEKQQLGSEDVAFMLAPRLNAAGRLGQATLGVELLTTDSTERAQALAEYLHELNGSRDSLERSIYLSANKQANEQFDPDGDAALVLAERGWHAGVIGIVAARLAEKFHRPVVLIALDELDARPGIGSVRSAGGFDVHAALKACTEHLVSHGGHAAAAGLKINAAQLDDFREAFCAFAAGRITSPMRIAEQRIDAEAPFSALTLAAVQQLERLAPFGYSNPRPVLSATSVTVSEPPRTMGGGDRHLSLRLEQYGAAFRAVAFGGGDWLAALTELTEPISVAFRPVINHFRGRHTVELQLCDWHAAAAPTADAAIAPIAEPCAPAATG